MELKRRFNFRRIITAIYVVAILAYLIVGLQPAEATQYNISGELKIPSIGLTSDITNLEIENHKLNTPDKIVGEYSRHSSKIFLFGHSSTVFEKLKYVKLDDEIKYNDKTYKITNIEILEKLDIDMNKVLAAENKNTLVIMTCAGMPVGEKDATHRLIVTALEK